MRFGTPDFDSDEEINLIDCEPIVSEAPPVQVHSEMEAYNSIATPERCVADFCLIPIGTPTASVSNEVAAVQRLMKSCGLEYTMHSAGTTVEGSWDDVMEVIGKAHSLIHKNGVARVQTDIRAGSRTDKIQHFSEKVDKVNYLLANDSTQPRSFTPASSTTTTSTQPPMKTSRSFTAQTPWISASMHLRRTFTPAEGAVPSVSSSGKVTCAGSHEHSLEFRTGFAGLEFRHLVYTFLGVVMVRSLLFARPLNITVTRHVMR